MIQINKEISIKTISNINCELGEGLYWEEEKNLLWFVDILSHKIFWIDLDNNEKKKLKFIEPVSWIIPSNYKDKYFVGFKSGIGIIDPFSFNGKVEWLFKFKIKTEDIRCNDAKVDLKGRLWFGTVSMINQNNPIGVLYKYDFKKNLLLKMDDNYKVTNGPAFDSQCKIMVHNDSLRKITYIYDYNLSNGTISNKRIFKKFNINDGYPDGMNFDKNDNLWIAHWGAGKVSKYDINGKKIFDINLPTENITNICFGGKDLNRIFVSSAKSDALPIKNTFSESGNIFEIIGLKSFGQKSRKIKF